MHSLWFIWPSSSIYAPRCSFEKCSFNGLRYGSCIDWLSLASNSSVVTRGSSASITLLVHAIACPTQYGLESAHGLRDRQLRFAPSATSHQTQSKHHNKSSADAADVPQTKTAANPGKRFENCADRPRLVLSINPGHRQQHDIVSSWVRRVESAFMKWAIYSGLLISN